MLRYASYDVVYQEIPDHVTLAFNISGCPNGCVGCHSPHLMQDVGEELTVEVVINLLSYYSGAITCVCFMGGDSLPINVVQLAQAVKHSCKSVALAWYSGQTMRIETLSPDYNCFDYIKLGPYIEALGGLNSRTTNQRFYARDIHAHNVWNDKTSMFWSVSIGD